jgi:hypothetical protein
VKGSKEEVRPSGVALSIAQKWLRLSSTSQAFDGDADNDAAVVRPQGLGLGAKPNAGRQTGVSALLEKKLGKRLRNPEQGATAPSGPVTSEASQGMKHEPPGGEASDSDEEGGRGTAFQSQKSVMKIDHVTSPTKGKNKKLKR